MDIISGYPKECPLCRLAHDGEVLTRLHYEDDRIIIVDCIVCRVPMAVLKIHRNNFEPLEKDLVRGLFRKLLAGLTEVGDGDEEGDVLTLDELRFVKLLPDWAYFGQIQWVIDWEQRQIPDHPHCHLRPFPFPDTTQWEALYS